MTRHARLSMIGCAMLICGTAFAQSRLDVGMPDLLGLRQDARTGLKSQADARSAVAMDAPLDAVEYFVGPGDVMSVNIWSAAPSEHQLTVTPEAFLIVPAVGSVDVRDLTLESVRAGAITSSHVTSAIGAP